MTALSLGERCGKVAGYPCSPGSSPTRPRIFNRVPCWCWGIFARILWTRNLHLQSMRYCSAVERERS